MSKVIAILATMDTKCAESDFIRNQIEILGGKAILIDVGVVGKVKVSVDISNDEVARAGGGSMEDILKNLIFLELKPLQALWDMAYQLV